MLGNDQLTLTLEDKTEVAQNIVQLRFRSGNGRSLSEWAPGAHLELHLPSGLIRQYSLCGPAAETDTYTVAVLKEPESRGGSAEIHEVLQVGDDVVASEPRNHFKLVPDAQEYVFLAGGIGITPLKSMIEQVQDRPWRLIYGGRTRSSMAYANQLKEDFGDQVTILPEDEVGRPDLKALVESLGENSVLYSCGPSPLLDAIQEVCDEAGVADRLHLERFSAGDEEIDVTGDSFEVEIASSGQTVVVGEDESILDALRPIFPNAPSSCREGYCGTCETGVLEGQPEHRGTLMSPEEHDEEGTMLLCVSRSCSAKLVLDL